MRQVELLQLIKAAHADEERLALTAGSLICAAAQGGDMPSFSAGLCYQWPCRPVLSQRTRLLRETDSARRLVTHRPQQAPARCDSPGVDPFSRFLPLPRPPRDQACGGAPVELPQITVYSYTADIPRRVRLHPGLTTLRLLSGFRRCQTPIPDSPHSRRPAQRCVLSPHASSLTKQQTLGTADTRPCNSSPLFPQSRA